MTIMIPKTMLIFCYLLIIIIVFNDVVGFNEKYFHEEFYKDLDTNEPIFNDDKGELLIYSKPKICVRQERQLKRNRRNKGSSSSSSSTRAEMEEEERTGIGEWWLEFMNEFYWDDGREYFKWLEIATGDNNSEEISNLKPPWFAVYSIIFPMVFYFFYMLMAAIIAPVIASLFFRFFYKIWTIVSGHLMKKFLRRVWTGNEIGKREQVLLIYMWAKKAPKIRAQLPWFLRKHPDEDVPDELKKLIPESSSPESSLGEDNVDYYYEGYEEENKEAIQAQKARMKQECARIYKEKSNVKNNVKKKVVSKKIAPWKKLNNVLIGTKKTVTMKPTWKTVFHSTPTNPMKK